MSECVAGSGRHLPGPQWKLKTVWHWPPTRAVSSEESSSTGLAGTVDKERRVGGGGGGADPEADQPDSPATFVEFSLWRQHTPFPAPHPAPLIYQIFRVFVLYFFSFWQRVFRPRLKSFRKRLLGFFNGMASGAVEGWQLTSTCSSVTGFLAPVLPTRPNCCRRFNKKIAEMFLSS